jgi:hypothetical protein
VPLSSSTLNDFFTSVFLQAPTRQAGYNHTIPGDSYIRDTMFLAPITLCELNNVMNSLSNTKSIGSDGLNPLIIKENFDLIFNQILYIFNLSFKQRIFPQMLKEAIVVPIFKSGSQLDAGNYRPISILTMFSKLLEKLFYNRLISFVDSHNIAQQPIWFQSKQVYITCTCTCSN